MYFIKYNRNLLPFLELWQEAILNSGSFHVKSPNG